MNTVKVNVSSTGKVEVHTGPITAKRLKTKKITPMQALRIVKLHLKPSK